MTEREQIARIIAGFGPVTSAGWTIALEKADGDVFRAVDDAETDWLSL